MILRKRNCRRESRGEFRVLHLVLLPTTRSLSRTQPQCTFNPTHPTPCSWSLLQLPVCSSPPLDLSPHGITLARL